LRTSVIALSVVVADQVSKWLVSEHMFLGQSIPVLGGIFRLTYIHNPGAVFGLRLGGGGLHLAVAVVAMVLVGAMLWRLPPTEGLARVALALVLGGAVGNVIDRVRLGEVIDFLDFGIGDVRWWIFNLADACVTTGAGLLVLAYGRQRAGEGDDGTEGAAA
jgi:signal peptidase II